MLPDSTSCILPLERLTRLYDGLEQLEDMFGDEMSQSDDGMQDDHEEMWAMDEHGVWQPNEEDGDDWVDEDEDDSASDQPLAKKGVSLLVFLLHH